MVIVIIGFFNWKWNYFSETNVNACGEQQITPLIAVKREEHHPEAQSVPHRYIKAESWHPDQTHPRGIFGLIP
ncbi:MAG: hypothetical protein Q8O64_07505 [Sideroxyarcus sp.]|nr:hypothetical protein [Sideroxyarcus sp.]